MKNRGKWYTYTKAGGPELFSTPAAVGLLGRESLRLDRAPQEFVSQYNALGFPAKCSQSLFPSPVTQVFSVLTQ